MSGEDWISPNWGFDKREIAVRTGDGRHFTLLEDLTYTAKNGGVYVTKAGWTTDGASIPRFLWDRGFAPFGVYWLAAVLHDGRYRYGTEPKQLCDWLFKEAAIWLGTKPMTANILYEGVDTGGGPAFRAARAKQQQPKP